MRKKSLLVTLDATQPSVIEITADETLQLDRIVPSARGRVAERHGALIQPGTTRVALEVGKFCFRTLSDTQLHVVQGGVATVVRTDAKDEWPNPKPNDMSGAKGDDPSGETPSFTVVSAATEA